MSERSNKALSRERIVISVVVIAMALAVAAILHSRREQVTYVCGRSVERNFGASEAICIKGTRPPWADPVAAAVVILGMGTALVSTRRSTRPS